MFFRQFSLVALMALCLSAAPISGLFNTGAGLADGASDPNWAILSPSQQAVVINQASIPGSWLPNTVDSRWIWETATGQPTDVTRTFRTTFTIGAGFDLATAVINGRWATDNPGLDIIFNGVSTGQTSPGFTAYTLFALASGFVQGVNTIDFVVQDVGSIAGFRAEFLSSNIELDQVLDPAIPEPGTWMLMALGLGALSAARFRWIKPTV